MRKIYLFDLFYTVMSECIISKNLKIYLLKRESSFFVVVRGLMLRTVFEISSLESPFAQQIYEQQSAEQKEILEN